MRSPNQNGVYPAEIIERLAEHGRSYAEIHIAQCDDGLYRYALEVQYSYGGFGGPITLQTEGLTNAEAARTLATEALLRRFPNGHAGDPQSVHDELQVMRAQLESCYRQPSLF